jgi:hypothetical protein
MDVIGLMDKWNEKIEINKSMSPLLPISMLMYLSYITFNIQMRRSLQTLSGIAEMGGLPPKNIPLYSYNRL